MIPITLDPAQTDIAVIGKGPLALRRFRQLRELGADPLLFSEQPDADLMAEAGASLRRRRPSRKDLHALQVVWVAGLSEADSGEIAADARAEKTLVNVEDVLPFCDFHTPAIVQRGKLLLTASTGGASPAAARFARETLEAAFPDAWDEALIELAAARSRARANGISPAAISAEAQAILARRGLIPGEVPATH
jgi:precorrin-2 dehydrogenase/sirohydrochlorin ferrochelatase